MPNIFKDGGGAGIGSYVVVFKDGELAENTDLLKLRGAYEAGEAIYFSIIDDETEDALVPATGWIDEESKLHLVARDMDDGKQYELAMTDAPIASEIEVEYEVKDQIEIDGEPIGEGGGESAIKIEVSNEMTFGDLAEVLGFETGEKIFDVIFSYIDTRPYPPREGESKGALKLYRYSVSSNFTVTFSQPSPTLGFEEVAYRVTGVNNVLETDLVIDFILGRMSTTGYTESFIQTTSAQATQNLVYGKKKGDWSVSLQDAHEYDYVGIESLSSKTLLEVLQELYGTEDIPNGSPRVFYLGDMHSINDTFDPELVGKLRVTKNDINCRLKFESVIGQMYIDSNLYTGIIEADHSFPNGDLSETSWWDFVDGYGQKRIFSNGKMILPVAPNDASEEVYVPKLDHGTMQWAIPTFLYSHFLTFECELTDGSTYYNLEVKLRFLNNHAAAYTSADFTGTYSTMSSRQIEMSPFAWIADSFDMPIAQLKPVLDSGDTYYLGLALFYFDSSSQGVKSWNIVDLSQQTISDTVTALF